MNSRKIHRVISSLLLITFICTNTLYGAPSLRFSSNLRVPLSFNVSSQKKEDSEDKPTITAELGEALQAYGLSLDSVTFNQVSGPVSEALGDPTDNVTLTSSLNTTNMTALSAYFNVGCAINPETSEKYDDATQRKKIADGGAVTVLEKMMVAMAEDLDITIIIGGSEGKTRDGAPALNVKQVINPNGKNGIYIVHADPIENTNAQAENRDGSWVLFFLTKLPVEDEILLREDADSANKDIQSFLTAVSGEKLAKYNIPFCHDRYVISVSYPGNNNATKIAQFDPFTDDPDVILQQIANEHNMTLEQFGEEFHILFLGNPEGNKRPRHNYIEDYIKELQRKGNKITYSPPTDGDAFARTVSPLGISTYKGKKYTIVLGGCGAIEGFAPGLVTANRISADGKIKGRVKMVHSSKNIPGQDLSGWDNYDTEDLKDFEVLGITVPNNVIREDKLSKYPERIAVFSSITGARKNVDISSDMPIRGVEQKGDSIEISSFVVDGEGRGFIATSSYTSSDVDFTRLRMIVDNNYGLLDDKNRNVRDFAIRQLLTANTDVEREFWQRKLGIVGLGEKAKLWLSVLLDTKQVLKDKTPSGDFAVPKTESNTDDLIDNVLTGKITLDADLLSLIDTIEQYTEQNNTIRSSASIKQLTQFAFIIGSERLKGILSEELDVSILVNYIDEILKWGDTVSELQRIADGEDSLVLAREFIVKMNWRAQEDAEMDISRYPHSELVRLRDMLIRIVNKEEFKSEYNTLIKFIDMVDVFYISSASRLGEIDSTDQVNSLIHNAWGASEELHERYMEQSNIVEEIRRGIHRICYTEKVLNLVSNYISFLTTGDSAALKETGDWPKPIDYDLKKRLKKGDANAKEAYELLLEIEQELYILNFMASKEKMKLVGIWIANNTVKDEALLSKINKLARIAVKGNSTKLLQEVIKLRIYLYERIVTSKGVLKFELMNLDKALQGLFLYDAGDLIDGLITQHAKGELNLESLLNMVYLFGIAVDLNGVGSRTMTEFSAIAINPNITLLQLKDVCTVVHDEYRLTLKEFDTRYDRIIFKLEKKNKLRELHSRLFRYILRSETELRLFMDAIDLLEQKVSGMIKDGDNLLPREVSDENLQIFHLHNAYGLTYEMLLQITGIYGGKANSLVCAFLSGLSVPEAFFIPPLWIKEHASEIEFFYEALSHNVTILEEHIGESKFGNKENPLLISVRSGAAVSFPGAMITIPFLGINDDIAKAIARSTGNEWFAYDAYRRFLEAYAMHVFNMDFEVFDTIIDTRKEKLGIQYKDQLSDKEMWKLAMSYKRAIIEAGYRDELKKALNDPHYAFLQAALSVIDSWFSSEAIIQRKMKGITDDWGTGVIVQRMVFGNFRNYEPKNKEKNSATAVLFSIDQVTRDKMVSGEYYPNAYGDDVVAGRVGVKSSSGLKNYFSLDVCDKITRGVERLHNTRRFPQEVEVTVEKGKVWWLQSRNMHLIGLDKYRPFLDAKEPIARGHGMSGDTFIGKVIFNIEDAIDAKKEADLQGLDGVILVTREGDLPKDVTVEQIDNINAFISTHGGITTHLAQVAILNNSSAILGVNNLEVLAKKNYAVIGRHTIRKGDILSMDAHPLRGLIYLGIKTRAEDIIQKLSSKVIRSGA